MSARRRPGGAQLIADENDHAALQGGAGFRYAVLQVLRQGEGYSEADFQALMRQGDALRRGAPVPPRARAKEQPLPQDAVVYEATSEEDERQQEARRAAGMPYPSYPVQLARAVPEPAEDADWDEADAVAEDQDDDEGDEGDEADAELRQGEAPGDDPDTGTPEVDLGPLVEATAPADAPADPKQQVLAAARERKASGRLVSRTSPAE